MRLVKSYVIRDTFMRSCVLRTDSLEVINKALNLLIAEADPYDAANENCDEARFIVETHFKIIR